MQDPFETDVMPHESRPAEFARSSALCAHLLRALLLRRDAEDDDLQAMIRAVHVDGTAMSRCFEAAGRELQRLERRSADVADFALVTYSGQERPERIIAATAHQAALLLLESLLGLMLPTRLEQYAEDFIVDEVANGMEAFVLEVAETQRLLARMEREQWLLCPSDEAGAEAEVFEVTVEEISFATAGADGLPRVGVKTIRERMSVLPAGRPALRNAGPPAVYAYRDWQKWWKGAGFSTCPELPSEEDARRLMRTAPLRQSCDLRER